MCVAALDVFLVITVPPFIGYRCDQYRWVSKGVYTIKCGTTVLNKRSNIIDLEDLPPRQGDSQFRRWEYWGYGSTLCIALYWESFSV